VKAAALVVLVLTVSARTRLNAVVLGQPISVPVLGLVALAVVLALAAVVLAVLRSVVRDWPRTVRA
jgi:hypothetical protein